MIDHASLKRFTKIVQDTASKYARPERVTVDFPIAAGAVLEAARIVAALESLCKERNTWARQLADVHDALDAKTAEWEAVQVAKTESEYEILKLEFELEEALRELAELRTRHGGEKP